MIYGLVEVWKHALLVCNEQMLKRIRLYLLDEKKLPVEDIIKFSLEVKKKFVEPDNCDTLDSHKALSLGHTFGNYLEMNHGLHHGPGVLYGIVLELLISRTYGNLKPEKFNDHIEIACLFEKKVNQLSRIQKELKIKNLVKELRMDKINSGDLFTFVVLEDDQFDIRRGITADELSCVLKKFIAWKR